MKRGNKLIALVGICTVAFTGTALATSQKYQTAAIKVSPKKLPAKVKAPVALTITTTTGDPGAPNGIPSPAVRAFVNFDSNLSLSFAGLTECSPESINGLTTEMAKATCPGAIVGGGSAKIRLPWPTESGHLEIPVVVTAFNGTKDPNGNRRIILFSRNDALAQGSALIGTVKKSTAGKGYGTLLDIDIPLLAGNAALVQFQVTVGNGYKRGFVKLNCSDRRINLKTLFNYNDGTSLPASGSFRCTR